MTETLIDVSTAIASDVSKYLMGSQLKWERDGMWFKADTWGHEGLTEWASCNILACSTLDPTMYIHYSQCKLQLKNGVLKDGCMASSFLNPNQTLVTLGKLLHQESLTLSQLRRLSVEGVIHNTINFVKKTIGLDIENYLRMIFTADAFLLNPDRHVNAVYFIYDNTTSSYSYCPLFDNGESLLTGSHINSTDMTLADEISLLKSRSCFSSGDRDIARPMGTLGVGFTIDGNKLDNFLRNCRSELGKLYDVISYQADRYNGVIVI